MKAVIGGILGLGMLCFASLASAQTAEATSATPTVNLTPQREAPLTERRWYGWQGLALDGGALTLGLTALALEASDSPNRESSAGGVALAGAVVYGLGAPVVHVVHERPWQGLASLGMRGALPVLGGALGLGLATCPPPTGDYGNCGAPEALLGVAGGALIAIALDATLLGWERRAVRGQAGFSLGLAPIVAADGRRELRVIGSF
jgi:hypothetical protein